MPRSKPWTPLPHEADLFCNVYIDESSQTKYRYLVLGGLLVPLSHAADFEADVIAMRDHTTPIAQADGTPKLMKWDKAKAYNLAAYKRVVDAFFTFPTRHKIPMRKHVDINCVVVDTSKKSLRATGDGDAEVGFNKEVYFLSTVMIGKRFKNELFHIYMDRRTIKDENRLQMAQRICTVLGTWRACARPICRRRKWCLGRPIDCLPPEPPMPPAERAKLLAGIRKAIEAELLRRGPEPGGESGPNGRHPRLRSAFARDAMRLRRRGP